MDFSSHRPFSILPIPTTSRYVANGSILSMAEKDWSFSFKINVDSMFLMSKAFLPNVCTLFALIRSATFCILKLNLTGYILDGEAEIWFDHQHVFRGFFNQGCAQQIRVWNNESCGHWDDQVYGGWLYWGRNQSECSLSRDCRHSWVDLQFHCPQFKILVLLYEPSFSCL